MAERKKFALCIIPIAESSQVMCTVPDDSFETLARLLGGEYREEGDHQMIDFSAIWDTLPPLREDTPGLEDYAQDLLFDEESLDSAHVLIVGRINIALREDTKTLFVIEVVSEIPSVDLS